MLLLALAIRDVLGVSGGQSLCKTELRTDAWVYTFPKLDDRRHACVTKSIQLSALFRCLIFNREYMFVIPVFAS